MIILLHCYLNYICYFIVLLFSNSYPKSFSLTDRLIWYPRIQKADVEYRKGFEDELTAFKERIRCRAKEKIEAAIAEAEEEERNQRLGPGGLDPVEVFESLPKVHTPFKLIVVLLYCFYSAVDQYKWIFVLIYDMVISK